MLNMSREKFRALIFFAVALALLLILAVGLTGIELMPGESLPVSQRQAFFGAQLSSTWGNALLWVLRGIMGLLAVLSPFVLIYLLFTSKGRRQLPIRSI
jgi:hypothetical protein